MRVHGSKKGLVVWHFIKARPSVFPRELAALSYQLECFFVIAAAERRFAFGQKFSKDAAYRPNINLVRVMAIS